MSLLNDHLFLDISSTLRFFFTSVPDSPHSRKQRVQNGCTELREHGCALIWTYSKGLSHLRCVADVAFHCLVGLMEGHERAAG